MQTAWLAAGRLRSLNNLQPQICWCHTEVFWKS